MYISAVAVFTNTVLVLVTFSVSRALIPIANWQTHKNRSCLGLLRLIQIKYFQVVCIYRYESHDCLLNVVQYLLNVVINAQVSGQNTRPMGCIIMPM
jgi:hypothetical protein